MSIIPNNSIEINLEGATVPFYKFDENGVTYYQFDSSKCGHPEPMINAMTGLQTIKGEEKLIMINSKAPMGLFPKVENDFSHEVSELEDGTFKIVFTRQGSEFTNTNFTDTACSGTGGGCSH